jgi:hypothetical protein
MTEQEENNILDESDFESTSRRHRHPQRQRGRFFIVRQFLNLIFMIMSVVGALMYVGVFGDGVEEQMGAIVIIVAICFKMAECALRYLVMIAFLITFSVVAHAQLSDETLNTFDATTNTFNPNRASDSLHASHKEVPKGFYVWTIDERFGDRTIQKPDTAMHLFMNSALTDGPHGEYNFIGNLGAPRISRFATDRDYTAQWDFMEPYSYFVTKPSQLHFTNTLSPITNLTYHSGGGSTEGEDHLKALIAVNANKRLGFGFKFDYDYGRGYYQNQANSLFDYTMWGSYVGSRYQAHLLLSFDHMKTTENGGISNDAYITHPTNFNQTFSEREIPVRLKSNWNRNDNFYATFSHRYNIGFYRKVEMTEEEKEARRFALRAKREKEEQEAQEKAEKTGRNAEDILREQRTNFKGREAGERVSSRSIEDVRRGIAKKDDAAGAVDSLAMKVKTESTDTSWLKEEYVPVTSFIHTLQFKKYRHIYEANESPDNYYSNTYNIPIEGNNGSAINDETYAHLLKNTFAVGLLEGFNKYIPMGAKVFITHQLRYAKLPKLNTAETEVYNENEVYIGGQLINTRGKVLRYNALAEIGVVGPVAGDLRFEGNGEARFKLFRDTAKVELKAFYHLTNASFLQRHYHSKHFWWDNNFSKQMRTHLEALVNLGRTHTTVRFAYDNFQNYVYLSQNYSLTPNNDNLLVTGLTAQMNQTSKNISLITLMLEQNFRLGILNWENRVTYQKSSAQDVLPVPDLDYWTNLYLDFRVARVLRVNVGGVMRIFSKYTAPEYCAPLGMFAVQENDAVRTKVGGYPMIDVYANCELKRTRFYIMMTHVNSGSGSREYFSVPHYPLNPRIFRVGVSITLFN